MCSDWLAEGSRWVSAFAFLIELVLNRTVKRPLELETLLGIPLLLSIPYLNGRNPLRLRWPRRRPRSRLVALQTERRLPRGSVGVRTPHSEVCGDDSRPSDPLFRAQSDEPQAEACRRHRLLGRSGNLDDLARGLAAALSETGDGKVLLVDMNVTPRSPFILQGHARMLAFRCFGRGSCPGRREPVSRGCRLCGRGARLQSFPRDSTT